MARSGISRPRVPWGCGPPGFLGPPDWVPWASRAWFPGLNLKIPKIALALFIVKKLRLAFLVVKKLPSAFLIVENVLAFLVVTKLPGHSKLPKMRCNGCRVKQCKLKRSNAKQISANTKQSNATRNTSQKSKIALGILNCQKMSLAF